MFNQILARLGSKLAGLLHEISGDAKNICIARGQASNQGGDPAQQPWVPRLHALHDVAQLLQPLQAHAGPPLSGQKMKNVKEVTIQVLGVLLQELLGILRGLVPVFHLDQQLHFLAQSGKEPRKVQDQLCERLHRGSCITAQVEA